MPDINEKLGPLFELVPIRLNEVPGFEPLAPVNFSLDVGVKSTSIGTAAIDPGLPIPDLLDETDVEFFYFGWESILGSWLIQRQVRLNSAVLYSNATAEPSYDSLGDAWESRTILSYPNEDYS